MSFNTPVTIAGDINPDGISLPTTDTPLKIGSVDELAQIQVTLNVDGDMSEIRCRHCGEDLNEDTPPGTPLETLMEGETGCGSNDDGPHEQEYAPLTWAKKITVSFDEERDEIDLAIATGEPRGAWSFKLRRTPEGVVLMHLPHPDMSGPHEPIRELRPGTFAIG